ncbi:MAG: endonuclease/exonuclease/phosphatase family protein [Bacteroidales bacterium]|nr:endonuclease/exonuclease/phosphatase family protein [Bacteroidales bacterium]
MKKLLIFAALVLLTVGMLWGQNKKNAVVGFYNLENLFDTENDPTKNDEQFLPEGDYQWTPERYQKKLENMSSVICLIGKEYGGFVVLGVSEVENKRVLDDLVATDNLKPLNLGVCHHDSPDRRGVDVAFLYSKDRFQIIGTNYFPVKTEDPNFITRDHFLMTGIVDGTDTVHFIVMHWPSKLGGEKRSMPKRAAAAQTARHIADSILATNINANIIFMGDFNDNPTAKSLKEYLKPKNKVKEVEKGDLFNPMWWMFQEGIGTYAYHDTWDVIDQIVISSNLVNPVSNTYKFVSAKVFRKNFMLGQTGSYTGYPFRTYAAGSYQGGYSDHFPVYIILEK